MKFLTQWLLVLLTVLNPILAGAALSDFDRQELAVKNWLAPYNSGFESGKAKWTASGGTLAAVTSGTNLLVGKGSATWDSGSAAQTLTSQTITIEKGYYGQNCEAGIVAQTPSGTATHTVQAYDGTNILVSATIVSSTTPRLNTVNFPCPQSGTVALRLVSVAADEPLIAIDDAYLGLARNVGSTQLISEWQSYTPTIGLTGGSTTAYGKYRRVGDSVEVQFDATFTTVFTGGTGSVSLPSVCSAIDTAKLPTGYAVGVGIPNSNLRLFDVSAGQWGGSIVYNDTTTVLMRVWVDDVGAGGNHVQVDAVISTTTPFTWANNDRVSGYFKVPCVGWTAQTIVMPDAQGWYVDASISGANVGLGTTSVSSYSVIGSSALSMTQAAGSAAVQVPCSGGNAPSGLTCSAGSELFGVAFNIPKSGAYRVCASANHYIDSPAGSINLATTFQLAETSTTSDTILQEGKGKAMSGSILMSGDRREYRSVYTCGNFVFSSVGQKVVKLMYETEISGTPDNHYIKADGDTILGQPDVHITVWPLSQQQQAILANSVTTTVTNGVKILTAKIQAINGSTCTVSEEDGDWLGATTPLATGRCTVAINAGVFSVSPKCFLTPYPTTYTGATQQATGHLSGVSTSAITVEVRYQAASGSVGADDSPTMLMCVGGR